MRLIDADALKEQVESHAVSMSVCLSMDEHYGKVTMREDCLQDINAAPTVPAIPVEWLRKWPKDLREGAYVRDILMDWQKEQEAQND